MNMLLKNTMAGETWIRAICLLDGVPDLRYGSTRKSCIRWAGAHQMAKRPSQSHVFHVGFFSRWYRLARPLVRAYVILFVLIAVFLGLLKLDWMFPGVQALLAPRYVTAALILTGLFLLALIAMTGRMVLGRRNIILNISRDMSQQRTFNLPSFLMDISPSLRRFLNGFAKSEEVFRETPYI